MSETNQPQVRFGYVDGAEHEKLLTKSIYLQFALEDALAELVKLRGEAFLDLFFERRVRRSTEIDLARMEPMPGMPDIQAIRDHRMECMKAGAEAIRLAVESVRQDPKTVD